MEGYLEAQISSDLFYHKYYFVLHEQTIIYCKEKGSNKIGQLHLSVCSIERKNQTNLHLMTDYVIIRLRAPKLELDKWELQFRFDAQNQKQNSLSLVDEMAKLKSVRSQFEDALQQLTAQLQLASGFAQLVDGLDYTSKQYCEKVGQWVKLMDETCNIEDSKQEFESCLEKKTSLNLPDPAYIHQMEYFLSSDKYEYLSRSQVFSVYAFTTSVSRDSLPNQKYSPGIINFWADLKPQLNQPNWNFKIYNYEPLSLLQRICEGMQYQSLLRLADTLDDSSFRLAHVVGFVIAQFSSLSERKLIPFKPNEGETYELEHSGFKFFAEQVSENITTFYSISDSFSINGQISFIYSFSEQILQINPLLKLKINLKKSKEFIKISFEKIKFNIINLITQRPFLQISGGIHFDTGVQGNFALVEFTNDPGQLNKIKGQIYQNENIQYDIDGQVDQVNIFIQQIEIISVKQRNTGEESIILKNSIKNSRLSSFGLQLNVLNQWNVGKLPLSDSRFRADIRALENGNIYLAQKEFQKIKQQNFNQLSTKWFVFQDDEYIFEEKNYKTN